MKTNNTIESMGQAFSKEKEKSKDGEMFLVNKFKNYVIKWEGNK